MEKLEIKDINSNYAKQVNKIYEASFSDQERLPFWLLFKSTLADSDLTAFVDEGKVVGFTYVLHYKDCEYLYYFAVDTTLRGKGYGSQVMQDFQKLYKDKNIYFCVEEPIELNQKRRIEFYKRNGFVLTDMSCLGAHNEKFFIMGKGDLKKEKFDEMIAYLQKVKEESVKKQQAKQKAELEFNKTM